jgi:hypothetical protein
MGREQECSSLLAPQLLTHYYAGKGHRCTPAWQAGRNRYAVVRPLGVFLDAGNRVHQQQVRFQVRQNRAYISHEVINGWLEIVAGNRSQRT